MKNNGISKGLFALVALVSFSVPMALFAPAAKWVINPRTGNRELITRYNGEDDAVANYVPVRTQMPDMIGRTRNGQEIYRMQDGTIVYPDGRMVLRDGRILLPDGTVLNRNQNQE